MTSSPHLIILGEQLHLRCDYVGVPEPDVHWYHDDMLLLPSDGVTISGGAPGDNYITLVIDSVKESNNGTYTCRVNNTIGFQEKAYMVLIVSYKLNDTLSIIIIHVLILRLSMCACVRRERSLEGI